MKNLLFLSAKQFLLNSPILISKKSRQKKRNRFCIHWQVKRRSNSKKGKCNAAIATQFALAVVYPKLEILEVVDFGRLYQKVKKIALDYRETAPKTLQRYVSR